MIGLQATGPHLGDQGPDVLAALANERIEQGVIGDATQRESHHLHGLHGAASASATATLNLRLDHRVVGHDMGHARLHRLAHDSGGGRAVLRVHTHIHEGIVQHRGLLSTCLEKENVRSKGRPATPEQEGGPWPKAITRRHLYTCLGLVAGSGCNRGEGLVWCGPFRLSIRCGWSRQCSVLN